MNALEREMMNTQLALENGVKLQTVVGDDGLTRSEVFIPEPKGFYTGADAPTMRELGVTGDPAKVAAAGGSTLLGMTGGAGAGIMGLIPDLLAMGAGPASQDAADRLQQNYGTEAWRQTFFDFVDTLDIPEPYKFLAKDAALVGEVTGLPGAAAAVKPVAKAVPKMAGAVGEAVSDYAAGAPGRIADRTSGAMLGANVDPTAIVDEAIVAGQKLMGKKTSPAGSTVGIREDEKIRTAAADRVKEISKAKGAARVKVDDLATYFDELHLQTYGRKLDPYNDQDFETAAEAIADEVNYQTRQSQSGAGWYDSDVKLTFEKLSKTPGLESLATSETDRVIWSALAAPTSIGQLVKNNTRAATAAFLQYKKTGKVPIDPPAKGATTAGIKAAGWGLKGKSVAAGMKVIAHLIETKGPDGFADWWLSPHPLSELTAIRKAAGLSGAPSGLSGGKDSLHFGSMVLGDKTGRFSLNINGYKGTTKDVWFSRSYNRQFGQMYDKRGEVAGGPRDKIERRRMEDFTKLVLRKIDQQDLSEQDEQAILWFYEQGLFTDLGVGSRPGSFSEAAEVLKNELRSGVRAGDGAEVAAEPGAETLVGFRGVGERQRAVRSVRRDELEALNSPASGAGQPGPYRVEGSGDDGAGRLLEPNPSVVARYEAAGLSVPRINQVDAATDAQKYHNDMVDAMAGHPMGAQVEIKSFDDLSGYQLFRTEAGSGFAIKPDGDVVAVFAAPGETKGGSYAMLQAAVAAGGKKLDAFRTYLPRIYETVGFKPVARVKWNDDYAPPGWDKQAFADFQQGEPDVVLFVYDPKHFGETDYDTIPLFDDFDEAAAVQDEALKSMAGE